MALENELISVSLRIRDQALNTPKNNFLTKNVNNFKISNIFGWNYEKLKSHEQNSHGAISPNMSENYAFYQYVRSLNLAFE